MRIAPVILLLVAVAPAGAQQPQRRAVEPDLARALLEARLLHHRSELRSADHELHAARVLTELQSAELHRLREGQATLASLLSREAREPLELQHALATPALAVTVRDQLSPDSAFEAALDAIAERDIPVAWAPQDPADSLYRAGREQLNAGQYSRAASTFERIRRETRFRQSEYRPAAYYWEAFALSRTGSADDLQRARDLLRELQSQFRDGATGVGDASALAATIDGRLARLGDERARVELQRALEASTVRSRAGATNAAAAVDRRTYQEAARLAEESARVRSTVTATNAQCPGEDIRTVALNALLQMDPEQAVPLLREIMERRDDCSLQLRRRAMMMLAERQDPETQAILVDAALNDPDPQVRMQATFWLSHVPGEAAVDALARILAGNPTPAVRERAIFALSQQPGERAADILREYILRTQLSEETRRQIVYALAHSGNASNAGFLRQLYERTNDPAIKEQIVMTLLRDTSAENADWILRIASDPDEPVRVRRQAILMTAHAPGLATDRLIQLYDSAPDAEIRRYILNVLGQRVQSDSAAVGKLVDIARTTDDTNIQRTIVVLLSQSRDPRAIQLMAELVRQPNRR